MYPPAAPLVTSGPSYEDVERTRVSLWRAQEKDTQWFTSLFWSSALTRPMEWGGFNSQLARQSTGCTKRGPSMYLFGPLINAPPAHPDRVLTSVMYMMKSLTDLGMTYIHLSPNLQLYIQAIQIKWSEPQAFDRLILRPGVMHIEQNVCGCIGQLMMGSGLADLIGSAFGGGGSIVAQGNHGCLRCANSEWFSCNHSCRPVSRRGMRSASTLRRHVCILEAVAGWMTSSP